MKRISVSILLLSLIFSLSGCVAIGEKSVSLTISYIISELFLLGVHLVMNENQRLKELVRKKEEALRSKPPVENKNRTSPTAAEVSEDTAEMFLGGFDTLTAKETELFHAYVGGTSTKDIMIAMDITENTLKFHSRNLYGKLGVTSRKQMVSVYRSLCLS